MKVLVPRPRAQAQSFADALRAHGLEPVVAEVVRIVPGDGAVLDAALAQSWDWVVFTSANAVEHTLARGAVNGRVAAVGERTAAALRARGVAVDLVPAEATGAGLAREMAARVRGAAVLYPRAAEGRDEVVDGLRAAGARVTVVAAYRTEPVPAEALAPLVARLRGGDIDGVAFFAPSQVAPLADALERVRVIAAVGPTTAAALRDRGVRVDVVADEPSAEALASAIALRYRSAK